MNESRAFKMANMGMTTAWAANKKIVFKNRKNQKVHDCSANHKDSSFHRLNTRISMTFIDRAAKEFNIISNLSLGCR